MAPIYREIVVRPALTTNSNNTINIIDRELTKALETTNSTLNSSNDSKTKTLTKTLTITIKIMIIGTMLPLADTKT
jgi:hypothetical protein